MTTHATVLRAFSDPLLLGRGFSGSSWEPWRALLAGAFALPLTTKQAETFRLLTDRDPPAEPVRELWVVAGRRSGKSRVGSGVAVALAACHDWPSSIGEVPTVLYLAADREQAQVAFRYARGLLAASPLLGPEVASETRDRIVLRSGVELQIATSDFRRVRGRSVAVAVLDEIAFWPVTPESSNPDSEVLAALRPSLATFPNSLLIGISSPYAQQGTLFDVFRRYYGINDPRVLVARAPTLTLNPGLPPEVVAEALESDPAAAAAEWLAQFRSDIAGFLDAPLVDGCTRPGPRELPRIPYDQTGTPVVYLAGVDVSGGRGDAASAAIAHREGETVIVDACRRWPSPHDPMAVAAEVVAFLHEYELCAAYADRYGAELSRSIYAQAGATLMDTDVNRSEAYLHMLPLLASGRAELPPDPTLRQELLGLERRAGRSGRDTVDHRPGGHDDVANAVALAVCAATRNRGSMGEVFVVYSDLAAALDDGFGFTRSALMSPWP